MKTINYKGKGEHSVNELELIIEQQAEELHLLKSGQKQLPIHVVDSSLPDDEYIDALASIEAIKYYFANDYNYTKARTIFISAVNWYKKQITK